MKEYMEAEQKMCDIKRSLLDNLSKCVCSKDFDQMDKGEFDALDKVFDWLKDLAEAEKNCWEGAQAKAVTEAMKKAEEDPTMYQEMDYGDLMGYNHNRYASGRYAPKGHGHYSGYTPSMGRMGYHEGDMMWEDPRYGEDYERYKMAKRHYHESGDMNAKNEMDSHAKDHVKNFIETAKEMYETAGPELQKTMKEDLTKLIREMPS